MFEELNKCVTKIKVVKKRLKQRYNKNYGWQRKILKNSARCNKNQACIGENWR